MDTSVGQRHRDKYLGVLLRKGKARFYFSPLCSGLSASLVTRGRNRMEEIGWSSISKRSRRRHTKRKSVRRPVDHCLLIIIFTSNCGSLSEGDFHPGGGFCPTGPAEVMATTCLCHPRRPRCPQAGRRAPACSGDPLDPDFLLTIKPQKAERRGRANQCFGTQRGACNPLGQGKKEK